MRTITVIYMDGTAVRSCRWRRIADAECFVSALGTRFLGIVFREAR